MVNLFKYVSNPLCFVTPVISQKVFIVGWSDFAVCVSISIKYNKFKLSGEITRSGDKKVGPSLIVLVQAKRPVSPRCIAVDLQGSRINPEAAGWRSEAQHTPAVFTAGVLTEQDLQIWAVLFSYQPQSYFLTFNTVSKYSPVFGHGWDFLIRYK